MQQPKKIKYFFSIC